MQLYKLPLIHSLKPVLLDFKKLKHFFEMGNDLTDNWQLIYSSYKGKHYT